MNAINTYAPKDLAAELKIPYRLVLRAITNGELRCVRYSKKIRMIRSEDAAKWIASITK